MNYQSKGFQISLLIHAGIFLLISFMSTRISESRLSPPIIIDFALLEEVKEPEPPPMVEEMMEEKFIEAAAAPPPPKMEPIPLKPKEAPKPKEKPKPVVRKEPPPAPKKTEAIKELPAPSALDADPKDTSEAVSSLTGSSFSEDSPVAAPAPSGSGGSADGVPGGSASVTHGTYSGSETTGSDDGTSDNLTFGTGTGPRYRHKEMPIYPHRARRLGKEGNVLLRLSIDENGQLVNIEVLEDPGYGFADAAIEAVKKSSFIPPTINGKPIRARALLPIKFTLR